jgi:hypothetical protein
MEVLPGGHCDTDASERPATLRSGRLLFGFRVDKRGGFVVALVDPTIVPLAGRGGALISEERTFVPEKRLIRRFKSTTPNLCAL